MRGLNPQTVRSWPELKSDAQPTEPPRHPKDVCVSLDWWLMHIPNLSVLIGKVLSSFLSSLSRGVSVTALCLSKLGKISGSSASFSLSGVFSLTSSLLFKPSVFNYWLTFQLKYTFFLFFLNVYSFLRDRVWAGEGQRQRETQNSKQAPDSELSAQSPTRGSNSWIVGSWPEPKLDA